MQVLGPSPVPRLGPFGAAALALVAFSLARPAPALAIEWKLRSVNNTGRAWAGQRIVLRDIHKTVEWHKDKPFKEVGERYTAGISTNTVLRFAGAQDDNGNRREILSTAETNADLASREAVCEVGWSTESHNSRPVDWEWINQDESVALTVDNGSRIEVSMMQTQSGGVQFAVRNLHTARPLEVIGGQFFMALRGEGSLDTLVFDPVLDPAFPDGEFSLGDPIGDQTVAPNDVMTLTVPGLPGIIPGDVDRAGVFVIFRARLARPPQGPGVTEAARNSVRIVVRDQPYRTYPPRLVLTHNFQTGAWETSSTAIVWDLGIDAIDRDTDFDGDPGHTPNITLHSIRDLNADRLLPSTDYAVAKQDPVARHAGLWRAHLHVHVRLRWGSLENPRVYLLRFKVEDRQHQTSYQEVKVWSSVINSVAGPVLRVVTQ